jgi:hypothetical protein
MTPDTIHSMPVDRSADPYPVSLLSQPMKQWRKPNICRWQVTRLTGHISPTCDQYIQYLLTWANPSVLNRYRRGLQPWRCRLATYHSLTFPTSCLHFPLRAPSGLQFNQVLSTNPKCWVLKNIWSPRSLSTTQPSTVANDQSLIIGVTRIDWKGCSNATRYQYNS